MMFAQPHLNERYDVRPVVVAGIVCFLLCLLAPSVAMAQDGGIGGEDGNPGIVPEAPVETQSTETQPAPESGEEEGVSSSEYMTFDVFVQDEELADVLQMLSVQSRRNIVASQDISATVTANLHGVTFFEALDSILHMNGYGYIERGNFIYVHTLEEIRLIQERDRSLETRVMQLNYLNANDAAEFVTPILSEVGQIKTNGDAGDFNLPEDTPSGSEQFALAATLVIYDYPEHIDEVVSLLKELDTRPAQVLVESTILQMQLSESNAFGVDFSVLNDVDFSDFFGLGGPLGAAGSLIGGGENGLAPADNQASALTSTPGNTSGPATLRLGIIEDDVSVFIRALDEVSDVTILSTPKLLTLNRQPARVLVGRKVGFLNTTSTETSTTQTVEFLDTGTKLSFRPFISKDGNIRMELRPSVSEGVIRNETDATGAAVTIPDEITQELTTNLIVRDGSTVVLGGLFREQTTLSRSQVPVLGDIPMIGTAFRGHDDATDRSEIIFMIKPTIVNDQQLAEQGDRAMRHAERLRVGSRRGLLPFSRDRQTARLNLRARELAENGETEKAIWNLRRSLQMSPVQPGTYELLETMTGEPARWPERSAMEQIIDGVVEEIIETGEQQAETGRPDGSDPVGENASADEQAHREEQTAEASSDLAEAPPVSEPAENDEPAFDPVAWMDWMLAPDLTDSPIASVNDSEE